MNQTEHQKLNLFNIQQGFIIFFNKQYLKEILIIIIIMLRLESIAFKQFVRQSYLPDEYFSLNSLKKKQKSQKSRKLSDLVERFPKILFENDVFTKSINSQQSVQFITNDKCSIKTSANSYWCQQFQNQQNVSTFDQCRTISTEKKKLNHQKSQNLDQKINNCQQIEEQFLIIQANQSYQRLINQFHSKNMVSIINNNRNQINLLQNYIQSEQNLNQTHNYKLNIDEFKILHFCGKGTFGSVFVAQHINTKFVYALKKIEKQNILSQNDYKNAMKEITIHRQLCHSNIINFYDHFQTQTSIYLVLELCPSTNLRQKIKKQGCLTQKNVKKIVKQVFNALKYLNGQQIIHRDLKTQNILIYQDMVKICDFGWAIEEFNNQYSICGTPSYISPQVLQSQQYNHKIDIWSLGIITFQLLYGRTPFQIQVETDLTKIIYEQVIFPVNSQVSQQCIDFISKCLKKNPNQRWNIQELLDHDFLKKISLT